MKFTDSLLAVNKNLEQQIASLKEHDDNALVSLRETDATLEKVQFGSEEQEASCANEISLFRSELNSKGEQISESVEDKIASEEEKKLKLIAKLTEERKKLVNEHESLVDARKLMEQRIASLYENLSQVIFKKITTFFKNTICFLLSRPFLSQVTDERDSF